MKKLLLISKDETLSKRFSETDYFQVINRENLNLLSQDEPDVLVISDKLIDSNELIEKAEVLEDYEHVFYMLSGLKRENEQIHTICKGHNIEVIQPGNSVKEIVAEVISMVFPKNMHENNAFLFFGADAKVGTTTVAQTNGEFLAERTDKKIIYMALDKKPNDSFIENDSKSIDNIRNKVSARILTFEDLFEECYKKKNFYFLPGPIDLLNIRKYSVEDIFYLMDLIMKRKDCILIVDAGSELDNPLTMAALQRIQNKFLVTTTQPSALKAYQRNLYQVFNKSFLNINGNDFLLIINKFEEHDEVEPKKLAMDYHVTYVGSLPHVDYGLEAEKNNKTVAEYDSQFLTKNQPISRIIASKANVTIQDFQIKKRKGILTALTKVMGG